MQQKLWRLPFRGNVVRYSHTLARVFLISFIYLGQSLLHGLSHTLALADFTSIYFVSNAFSCALKTLTSITFQQHFHHACSSIYRYRAWSRLRRDNCTNSSGGFIDLGRPEISISSGEIRQRCHFISESGPNPFRCRGIGSFSKLRSTRQCQIRSFGRVQSYCWRGVFSQIGGFAGHCFDNSGFGHCNRYEKSLLPIL